MSAGKFELVVFSNIAGGSELVSGDLDGAIEKFNAASLPRRGDTKHTGLCAAYTAAGEFASAEKHCRAAISISSAARNSMLISQFSSRAARRENEAVALNNMGVLLALQGEPEKALKYFRAAGNKSARLSKTSSRNMDALEQRAGTFEVAGRL